ncbi:MAG: TIGR00266 family protein [Porcipelethomonas sp.]
MRIEIKGTPMPVAICYLSDGESIITEKGAMSWMTPNLEMQTSGGGIGSMMSRAFSGESMFRNIYTSHGEGMLAMASSFPGEIIEVDVANSNIVAQKRAFLASEPTVETSIFFQKKLGAGFFGGEGFIMQKFSGKGKVLLELDGSIMSYTLGAGESMMIDTGNLALMEETCSIEIEKVKGAKNKFLGGEGLFNTKVTGPGKIWLQTMPADVMAQAISPFLSTAK